ncbi:MAG: phosphoribosylanthranilate isomerase [Verrucomicrobiota bacterium]
MKKEGVKIKICCISSLAEAKLAIACGADALGLVSAMPSGPGMIDEDLILRIAKKVPPPIATFLLSSSQCAFDITRQQQKCRTNTIQICDRLQRSEMARLRVALPGIALVQVIHVRDESSVKEALSIEPAVDALLLDSGNQSLKIKELGGTGRAHDWNLSREIRQRLSVPVFLAGGLRPDNVAKAIAAVRPFGVDVCSGVRSNGQLSETKLRKFIAAVRSA